jgi:signal transduction histidine kinase
MPAGIVENLVQSADGRVYAATNSGGLVELANGKAIASPGATAPAFAEVEHRVATDGRGAWWIGTRTGELYWLPRGRPDYTRARLVWKAPAYPHDGIWVGPHIRRLSDGTVFVGGPKSQVFRASTDGDRPQLEPLLGLDKDNITSATLDRGGNLWLAGLGRLGRSANGVVEVIAPPPDIPRDARPHVPFVDSRGWLWVAFREQGVSVTRDPGADVPRFESYSTASGLSSDVIRSIAEDRLGRMYFGSARGLDRLDTSTGVIRRFGIHEGLAGATVWSLIADDRGRIWVGTSGGVSLIDVDASAPPHVMPPAYLTRVLIAGEEQPLPERGATGLPQLTLASDKNNLVLDWVAVTQASDVPLRYQYRLAGFDRGWSAPTSSRSVTYAGLGAGTYRFEVRALFAGRTDGGEAAILPFTVVAPIWRRPWFAGVVALLAAVMASWYHRLRLRQALAMERLRQQVALDLHDDVGSGLSEIAILSELAREEGSRAPAWADIAGRARSLRESMGDIVWAVDPRHDSLGELVQRMRQIAHNLLEAQGLQVDFTAPDADSLSAIDMAPDRRRNILLIFKEAVHNVAKHADARRVRIGIALEPRRLILSIDDDGRGFDQEAPRGGHGLPSLRRRADMIGGALKMQSRPGAGTRVELRVPLG